MPQDAAPPPSAQALTSAMAATSSPPREYYTDQPCTEGMGCGGEGIVLPFEEGNVELDEMFGFTDVESLPLSDEILPVIFDGALMTEEGLLDCFARHYPERAGFLLQLLSEKGGKSLGLGYKLEFLDDVSQADPMRQELEKLEQEYQVARSNFAKEDDAVLERAMAGRGGENTREIMLQRQRLEQIMVDIGTRRDALTSTLGHAGRWRIDDSTRKIHIYTTINANIDRMFLAEHVPFGDDGINPLPTNKEAADWLYAVMGDWMARNGYPGAGPEEEFFRNWLTRKAAGVALVGLGALEMFGGVTITIGSSGLATVGGVALTVVGFDAMTNGFDMLWTPNRHAGERGWIGDLIHDTAVHFGGEEVAQKFDRGWAVTQIAVGLGAPLVIRYAAKKAARVAASGQQIRPMARGQLDTARLGIAEIKGHKFGRGLTGDYSPLPSGRGAIMSLGGIKRFLIPTFDSDIRVLLRLRGVQAARVQERSRELGQGMAGFAKGPITDQGKAISFVHEVGRHMGLSADDIGKIVNKIEFGQRPVSSFNGRKILRLRQTLGQPLRLGGGSYNEFRAFIEVAHELNHALAYHRYLARGGNPNKYWRTFLNRNRAIDDRGRTIQYFEEEIRIENAAANLATSVSQEILVHADRAADVRRLLAEALEESQNYIARMKKALGQ